MYGLIFNDLKEINIMASKEVYTSDKELEDLYNSLEKGSLVRMLIEKHRQLEKQVKNLTIPVVVQQSELLSCETCKFNCDDWDDNHPCANCAGFEFWEAT